VDRKRSCGQALINTIGRAASRNPWDGKEALFDLGKMDEQLFLQQGVCKVDLALTSRNESN